MSISELSSTKLLRKNILWVNKEIYETLTIVKFFYIYPPTQLISIIYFCLWFFSFLYMWLCFASSAIIINLQGKVHDPLFQMLHWSPKAWRRFYPLRPISFVTLSNKSIIMVWHDLFFTEHAAQGSSFHCLLTAYRLSFNIFFLTSLHIDLLLDYV